MPQAIELHSFECHILRTSLRSIVIELDGEEIILPQSLIDSPNELPSNGNARVTIPSWLAKARGII